MDRLKPLFVVGPIGCGKTTYIKDLAIKQGRELLHCPCRKDRTLREQRSRIHEWAMRAEPSLLWLEGTDDLTPEAQSFLRRILETYSSNVLFCLEARTMESIQEPILSRCNIMRIELPDIDTVKSSILNNGIYSSECIDSTVQYMNKLHITRRQLENTLYVKTWYPSLYQHIMSANNGHCGAPTMDAVHSAKYPLTYIYDNISLLSAEDKDIVLRGLLVNSNPWALHAYVKNCVRDAIA